MYGCRYPKFRKFLNKRNREIKNGGELRFIFDTRNRHPSNFAAGALGIKDVFRGVFVSSDERKL